VPYADPRAYTDRLNALVSPQGWTRTYVVETMNNITRMNKGESVVSGKVLVTCTLTIACLGSSHSGTGEEWADDPNGLTAADAQAFKRACACFGLGRYFYDFVAPWVDLDQYRQPINTPTIPSWAVPENWRNGARPPRRNQNGNGCNDNGHGGGPSTAGAQSTTGASNGNGHGGDSSSNVNGSNGAHELDVRITRMEGIVGTALYRRILREHGRVNQPKLIREAALKQKVLRVLESAARGLDRLQAVTQRLDPNTVSALLAKLQAPPLDQITDMKTLGNVVLGLEELAGSNHHSARGLIR
jgi:hypothetical protein